MTATETGTDTNQSAGIPWRSPALIAILGATLITPMDVPLLSPVLPEIQAVFGISESRAGLLITVYAIPGIVLAPVLGVLADRIGRRRVLSGCLVLFGLAGTAIGFTNDFTVALTLRLFQGIAAGSLLSALAMTAIGDRYTGTRHDAVMGITAAMLSLGTAAYPLLGGYLAAYAWNAPFLLYALTLPVTVLVLVGLDDHGSQLDSGQQGYVREAIRTIPTARALSLFGIMLVSFTLLFGGFYTALPFYLVGEFGYATTTVGLISSAVLLVAAVVSTQNGRIAARTSRTMVLVTGFGLYAGGFLGVALAGSSSLLVGALLVFGAGSGLVTPTLFAGLSALAPDGVRAGVMSLQTTTIGVSQLIGPVLFTYAGGAVGYQSTLLGASVAATVFTTVLAGAPLDL